jgi:hypothetical protein
MTDLVGRRSHRTEPTSQLHQGSQVRRAPSPGEVERILGRPAGTIAVWAADHAAAVQH